MDEKDEATKPPTPWMVTEEGRAAFAKQIWDEYPEYVKKRPDLKGHEAYIRHRMFPWTYK